MITHLMAAAASLVATAALLGLIRPLLWRAGVVDVPNSRSSHSTLTPRGGGLAIVLVMLPAFLVLGAFVANPGERLGWAVMALSLAAVATVGWMDDRRSLSAKARFGVHAAAVAAMLAALGGLAELSFGAARLEAGIALNLVTGLACIWYLNAFNFMDGIDGLAGAEATFVAAAMGALAMTGGAPAAYVYLWWTLAGAGAGFLIWNWPPARIFLGDVGSGFLGGCIAIGCVATVSRSAVSPWTAAIVLTPFVADATATLLRRVARGERWYIAHRSHGYQWLSRRWNSHLRVTLLYSAVNVLVIAPLAAVSHVWQEVAHWIFFALLSMLMLLLWLVGAGRAEAPAKAVGGDGRTSGV